LKLDSCQDVIECQRLRYLVFNCELGEGFDGSDRTGLDRDRFDFICDHLMVRDSATGKLAGTYRMQSGYRARGNLGYYGEEFFDFGRSKKSAARFWSLEGPVYIGSTATPTHALERNCKIRVELRGVLFDRMQLPFVAE